VIPAVAGIVGPPIGQGAQVLGNPSDPLGQTSCGRKATPGATTGKANRSTIVWEAARQPAPFNLACRL